MQKKKKKKKKKKNYLKTYEKMMSQVQYEGEKKGVSQLKNNNKNKT